MRILQDLAATSLRTTADTEHGKATLTQSPPRARGGPSRNGLSPQRRGDNPLPAMRQFMYGRSGTHVEDQVLE